MAILFDPNVIYLLIVGGLIVAVMALIAPGTGILEGVAFVILGVAVTGMVVNQQALNEWALGLALIGLVLFLVALRRPQQRIILLAATACLIVGSAYILESAVWWRPAVHPLLAALVSILASAFFWLAGIKAIEAQQMRPRHLQTLVGQVGEARTPVHREGSVFVDGEAWSAYSDQPIGRGARVRVVEKDGFRIKVEALRSEA